MAESRESFAANLRGDLVAGVTTGVLAVPQGIAFALIAHVPPEHGLYAMIVPTIVAALIRSSPFLVTGSTNTSALVVGSLVSTFALGPGEAVPIMLLIVLLMGVMQVAAGLLRLGAFGRYVSQAVLVGFTLGAAALIFTDQVHNVLGLGSAATGAVRATSVIGELGDVLSHARELDPRAAAIAATTIAILVGASRLSPAVPGAMIAIVVTSAAAWWLGWEDGRSPIRVVGDVPAALPQPTMPLVAVTADRFQPILAASAAIAILGMVEAISIGKALSAKAQAPFDANRELLAKGAGNVAGAFFGCMPTSASWTRSAINLQLGAKTRWVGVISGLTVLVIMLAFAPAARWVPRATLGAIIMWIAVLMVDVAAARYVWRWSRADGVVTILTFVSTLLLPIQYAIYLGVVLSLLLLVRRVGKLQMVEMVESAPRLYREIELDEETGSSAIVVLALEGDLFFGVAEELEENLEAIETRGARVIVIRMKRAHAIDATAAETLATFATHFRLKGGRLMLCGLKPELYERIGRSHLGDVLGAENVLPTDDRTLVSLRRALGRARRDLTMRGNLGSQPLMRRVTTEAADQSSYSI